MAHGDYGTDYAGVRSDGVNIRIVNVTRESEYLRRQRLFRACFGNSPEPTRITFDQLYETLAHGEPGEYILLGA